jgi:hypothetical protein
MLVLSTLLLALLTALTAAHLRLLNDLRRRNSVFALDWN